MPDPSTLNELFFHLREVAAGRSLLLAGPTPDGRFERRSTADFVRSVHSLTLAFDAEGLTPETRVALLVAGRPEWHEIDFACHLLGAVVVPLDPASPAAELERALRNSGAAWLVYSAADREVVSRAAAALPTRPRRIVLDAVAGADETGYVRLLGLGAAYLGDVPIERFRGRVVPDSLASILYTSGTTGPPKGVMASHASLMAGATTLARLLPIERRDRLSTDLSPAHGFQRTLSAVAFLQGARLIYRTPGDARPLGALVARGGAEASREVVGDRSSRERTVEEGATVLAAAPASWQRAYEQLVREIDAAPAARRHLLRRGVAIGHRHAEARRGGFVGPFLALRRSLGERLVTRRLRARFGAALRFGIAAGAPLRPEVGDFFEALGLPVFEGYGVTETSPLIAASRPLDRRQGSVGKPLDEVEVRIASDGEILVRSQGMMQGYWREPGATEASVDESGWLHTGDLGSVDRSGYLYVTDRKRDLLTLASGHTVTPRPIEALLRAEPGIAQAVVVGEGQPWPSVLLVPDRRVLDGPLDTPAVRETIDAILERVGSRLATENRPRAWAWLDAPLRREVGELGPTDQIRRQVIARRYAGRIEALYRSAAAEAAAVDPGAVESDAAVVEPETS